MLSPQEAFKLGFLSNCVEKGLSIEQMREEVKKASDQLADVEKKAFLGPERAALWDDLGDLLKDVGRIGMGGLILGPPAVGATAGILHSRLSDVDDEDVEDVKKREVADEYRRQAQRLRQTARMRDHRASKKRSGGLYL
jgi:enoyl-CoA hydratase/carnithine racemase